MLNKKFINEVQKILNAYSWEYYAESYLTSTEDCDKVIAYLESQSFSKDKIIKELKLEEENILKNIAHTDEIELFSAIWISSRLAEEKISKFKASEDESQNENCTKFKVNNVKFKLSES